MHSPLMRFIWTPAAALVIVVGAACSSGGLPSPTPAASVTPGPQSTRPAVNRDATPMFEVSGISGWINSDPLTIQGLIGSNKVVLVDFWTYTCVNCIRTFPFLREWHAKYQDRGLVILGVHSPEFEFEKVRANVEKAVSEHGLSWPIAQDNDFSTWRAFGNLYWPAKYLIGVDGRLRYSHFGEGSYVETEKEIRAALAAAGYSVGDIPLGAINDQETDKKATGMTREIYGGYERNYGFGGLFAGQEEYYSGPDKVIHYTDSGTRADNKFYLHGVWLNKSEAVVHARETQEPEDYIALTFKATSVNVVVEPQGPEPFDIIVEINGKPLAPDQAGTDVKFDSQGRSMVTVTAGRLYSLVRLPEFGVHELKLRSTSRNFAVFAFTFGVYESGI
jgi:thiol-disulfide isomerase/thioredoxin